MCCSHRQLCKNCDQSAKFERLEGIDHILSEKDMRVYHPLPINFSPERNIHIRGTP